MHRSMFIPASLNCRDLNVVISVCGLTLFSFPKLRCPKSQTETFILQTLKLQTPKLSTTKLSSPKTSNTCIIDICQMPCLPIAALKLGTNVPRNERPDGSVQTSTYIIWGFLGEGCNARILHALGKGEVGRGIRCSWSLGRCSGYSPTHLVGGGVIEYLLCL